MTIEITKFHQKVWKKPLSDFQFALKLLTLKKSSLNQIQAQKQLSIYIFPQALLMASLNGLLNQGQVSSTLSRIETFVGAKIMTSS